MAGNHMKSVEPIESLNVRPWAGLLLLLGAVPGLLLAQADRAAIEGVVTDASGASIVAATVKTLRIETNDVIQLKTNEAGRYFLANLPLGTYRVTIEKEGFRTAVVDNLVLQSQMSVRADVKLTIGQVTDRVEVTAGCWTPPLRPSRHLPLRAAVMAASRP
jgi:Carboxypeptidase regulatory-like domain